MSLLLARLALLDFGRLARRRQAHGDKGDLQHGERREGAEQRGDGVGDDGREFVGVEREDDDGVEIGVDLGDVVFERLDGCGGAGLGLEGGGVNGDFAGHGCGDGMRMEAERVGRGSWWPIGWARGVREL